jgi:hypothetical protein
MRFKSTILNRNEPKWSGACNPHLAKHLIFWGKFYSRIGPIVAFLLRKS